MPERRVLVDTGPIVALLLSQEPRHEWATEQFKSLPAPLLTCEPVLTEASHFVRKLPGGTARYFELLQSGAIAVAFELAAELSAVATIARKYESVPASLADACLVRMAELHPGATVLTFDRHFRIYRAGKRRAIKLLMPD